jgi:uncharacterized membrane protein YbaN (DUF454 family)
VRGCWNAAGLAACGVGFVGLLVPGLPSTVFFILATACFSRGRERLRKWVLSLPKIGPLVRDYNEGLGMPLSAKCWAVGIMAVCVTLGSFAMPRGWPVILAFSAAALGASWIWFFIPTRARTAISSTSQLPPRS